VLQELLQVVKGEQEEQQELFIHHKMYLVKLHMLQDQVSDTPLKMLQEM
jgi:hypothetical protein